MNIRSNDSNLIRAQVSQTPVTDGANSASESANGTTKPALQADSLKLSSSKVSAYMAPEESLWYKIKKTIALALSGIGIDHTHSLTKDQATTAQSLMKPGDVLLRRVDYTSANMVIPGFFGHAAVYVGNGTIIDATTHGVRKISVEDFFAEGDHAMVIRPKELSEDQTQKLVQYAEDQVGKVYDFDLDASDDKRFTCTELVASTLKAATGKDFAQLNIMGGISPDDFKNNNFESVWTSIPEESKLEA